MPHGISLWNKDILAMRNTLAFDIHKGAGIKPMNQALHMKNKLNHGKSLIFLI